MLIPSLWPPLLYVAEQPNAEPHTQNYVNQRSLFRRVKRLRSISLHSCFSLLLDVIMNSHSIALPPPAPGSPVALSPFMCHDIAPPPRHPHTHTHTYICMGRVSASHARERLFDVSGLHRVCPVLGVMEKRVDIIGGERNVRYSKADGAKCNF